MSAGIFSTPRPLPSKLAPAIAGGSVIVLAFPVFAVAGWPLRRGRWPPSCGPRPKRSRSY